MNRRRLLQLLSSIPLLSSCLPAPVPAAVLIPTDGIFTSTLRALKIEEVYAWKGDIVTCQNQHPICVFTKTVRWGEMVDTSAFGGWTQEVPEMGSQPVCAQCGAMFCTSSSWHFVDGWRSRYWHKDTRIISWAHMGPF